MRQRGDSQSRQSRARSRMRLAVIAMDPIPPLRLAEVMPVVMSKRHPHVTTPQPHNVASGRSPPRPPMEGTTSAQRQPKLIVTQRPITMPTHARPPGRTRSLPGAAAQPDGEPTAIEINRTIPLQRTSETRSISRVRGANGLARSRVTRRSQSSRPTSAARQHARRASHGRIACPQGERIRI
jgi:hypothetical protein